MEKQVYWNKDYDFEEVKKHLSVFTDKAYELSKKLSTVRFSGECPEDLKIVAENILHDLNREISNMRYYLNEKENRSQTLWYVNNRLFFLYQCAEILYELLEYRIRRKLYDE